MRLHVRRDACSGGAIVEMKTFILFRYLPESHLNGSNIRRSQLDRRSFMLYSKPRQACIFTQANNTLIQCTFVQTPRALKS
jgi:hypothetical protein